MPYGIPRVACCASLNLWTETHGVCGLPLSTYLTSELFMHTPQVIDDIIEMYPELEVPDVQEAMRYVYRKM